MSARKAAKARNVRLVHAGAPGRVRYEILALYHRTKAAEWIRGAAFGIPGVNRARVNPVTGTLLVEFSPRLLREKELRAQLARLVRLGKRTRFRSHAPQQDAVAWHELPIQEVLARLGADPVHGLTRLHASRSRTRHGPNRFRPPAPRSQGAMMLHQFENLPSALLLGSAAVSLLTGGLLDAFFIGSVVLFNSGVGFWMERSAEKTITALTRRNRFRSRVIRGGKESLIPLEDVVVGDVLLLRAGDRVPADARILEADRLMVDESILTGESLPVEKSPLARDRSNLVFRGTFVSGGTGRALVFAVGTRTEVGRIQRLMETQGQPETPMQIQLAHLTNQLVIASVLASGGVLAIGMLRGRPFLDILKTTVSLAVAAIPESLPTVATLTLARGVGHLEGEGILARRLDAVETLASVDTVCFDKTGTVTMNRMQARWIETWRSAFDPASGGPWPADPAVRGLVEAGVLCNEAGGDVAASGGSSTEKALIELARAGGVAFSRLRKRHPRLRVEPRSEGRNYMITRHGGKSRWLAVKGSPEEVLALCASYDDGGKTRLLTREARARVLEANSRMASRALRVLGFAAGTSRRDLVWLGLVGLEDPIRPGVPELVERLHAAGIDTCMITGDQEATAEAVGKAVGIRRSFGRVSPGRKLEVVRELQASGRVVAMIGDGVNDGPALKSADLGIAMGARGTEVASQAADIVLPSDNLGAVIGAVREGRTVHQDIRKAVDYIVSQNLSEMVFTFASVALRDGAPLSSLQFLWVNLITDIFPELALAQEPPEQDVLARGPHGRFERILARADVGRVLLESGLLAAAPLGAQLYGSLTGRGREEANSLAFLTLTGSSLFYTLSARSERLTIFDRERLAKNKYIGLAIGAGFGAELLSVLTPALRRALYGRPVSGTDFVASTAASAAPMLLIEASKFVRRRMAA